MKHYENRFDIRVLSPLSKEEVDRELKRHGLTEKYHLKETDVIPDSERQGTIFLDIFITEKKHWQMRLAGRDLSHRFKPTANPGRNEFKEKVEFVTKLFKHKKCQCESSAQCVDIVLKPN